MNTNPFRVAHCFCLRRLGVVSSATLLFVASLQAPAMSEPTGFRALQSVIIGASSSDRDLQAIWDGSLRPKMQTLNARFETASGVYILSIKKDRCANTGNVVHLFACPARLAVMSGDKPVVIQAWEQFYFSGELPTSETAPSYVEQTQRNNTRLALDADKSALVVQDTNSGTTGTQTLIFTKP